MPTFKVTCPLLGNCGRLGNQLWQVASTLGIAASQGKEASFPSWAYQPYFSLPDSLFQGDVGIPATEFVSLPPEALPYLQDYGFWREIEEQIRGWLQPSVLAHGVLQQYSEFWKLEPPVMSCHVRRGDNATEGLWKKAYHPLRPLSYYLDALQLRDYQSVAFFSDDIQWCREMFGQQENFYFHEGTPRPKEHEPTYATAPVLDWIDLQLMTFADSHICSNSSYSYWGAFLSHDASPIYPAPFFGPKLSMLNADLMFPPNWQKVNHAPLT